MAITNQAVLQKMVNELQQAMAKGERSDSVREHVRAVRLLCDLILDEDETPVKQVSQLDQDLELKKMMGNLSNVPKSVPSSQATKSDQPKIDHGDANGNSIFDF